MSFLEVNIFITSFFRKKKHVKKALETSTTWQSRLNFVLGSSKTVEGENLLTYEY
jgi:hypothetical protein